LSGGGRPAAGAPGRRDLYSPSVERRHPAVLVLCAIAFAAAVAATLGWTSTAAASGKPSLTSAARELESRLKDRGSTYADFRDLLTEESFDRQARAVAVLNTLRNDMRPGPRGEQRSILAKVDTIGGREGTTTFLVDAGRFGGAGTRTIEWRRVDGRWRADLLGETR
jgi:hypothetical protein